MSTWTGGSFGRDEDRALHDHPWPFIVIPLWRGYIEHNEKRVMILDDPNDKFDSDHVVQNTTRVYPILGTRFRRSEYRHRVELFEGKAAWSLFIRFTKERVWGFWTPSFVPWNQFWKDNKCE